jgi:hypothetical protein
MRGISFNTESNRWTGTPSPGMLGMPTSPRKRGEVERALLPYLSPPAARGRIALAIRVRGILSERGGYRFKNAGHISQHIVVPEPQNSVVVIDKPFVANNIASVVSVLPSVYLDNEAMFAADKINCVRTDRLLPNEFVAIESTRPEPVPQSCFGFCGSLPQPSSALGFMLSGPAHAAPPPHPDCFAIRPLPARGERLASHAIR